MEKDYYWKHPLNPQEHCTIGNFKGEALDIIATNDLIDLSLDGATGSIPGLYQDGSLINDRKIEKYIKNNTEEAIYKAVIHIEKSKYLLNICNKDALPSQAGKEMQLARQQTFVYLPIIKYFLLYGFKNLFDKMAK